MVGQSKADTKKGPSQVKDQKVTKETSKAKDTKAKGAVTEKPEVKKVENALAKEEKVCDFVKMQNIRDKM